MDRSRGRAGPNGRGAYLAVDGAPQDGASAARERRSLPRPQPGTGAARSGANEPAHTCQRADRGDASREGSVAEGGLPPGQEQPPGRLQPPRSPESPPGWEILEGSPAGLREPGEVDGSGPRKALPVS